MKTHIVHHANYRQEIFVGTPQTDFDFVIAGNPRGETNGLPSQTIPGMTLSLHELLARYVKGDSVVQFNPVYTDDLDIPDGLEYMDEIERRELAGNIRESIENYQTAKLAPHPRTVPASADPVEPTVHNPVSE